MAYDKKIHGVVNTARHEGTLNGTAHTQVLVYNDNKQVDCDNGTVVTLGNYLQLDTTIFPNYEIYRAGLYDSRTGTDIKNIAIVSAPELIYDESQHYSLENFYNEAGKPVRAYFLKNHSILSFSKEVFSNPEDVEVGKNVYLSGEIGKMTVLSESDNENSFKIGYIESAYEYYYITMYQVRFNVDVD